MRKRNQSSPLARRGGVGQHAGHGKKSRPNFIYDCKQFVLRFFLRIRTRLILGLGPQTKPLSMTAHHGLVTSHCITLILRGQTIKPLGKSTANRKPEKTGDSPHTNPPLSCNTQQYAAQITPNTEHKYAPKCSHETMPQHPSWRPSPWPGNPRRRGRDYRRRTHTPPAEDHPRSTAVSTR